MSDGAAADRSTVVRAVFFGSGSFAVPILDALAAMPGIRVEAVVSAPDRPVGRKAILTPTPVAARARQLGLALLQPPRVRKPEAVEALSALAPDLALLADYGQLIPTVLLDLPRRGFLNLHPSALPRHRGASPIPATILAGDVRSAVSLMVVSEEMDAGPIVAVEPLEVRADDTAVTLEERAAVAAARLLVRALPDWLAGRIETRPQPSDGVTITRPLRRDDGLLDPRRSAMELERQVRAYQPWPGSYLESDKTGGLRLIVAAAHVEPSEAGDRAGNFVTTSERKLAIATADGRLVLDIAKRAGGREMSSVELLRGWPALIG